MSHNLVYGSISLPALVRVVSSDGCHRRHHCALTVTDATYLVYTFVWCLSRHGAMTRVKVFEAQGDFSVLREWLH